MGYIVKNVNLSVILSLTSLKSLGLWPPEGADGIKILLYYMYGFFCFMFALGSYIISQTVNLFQIWGDLPLMTANGCLLFTNLAHFIKIVYLVVRTPLIQTIIDDGQRELVSVTNDEGNKIIKSCNFVTKWQQITYYCVTSMTIIVWASSPEKGQLLVPSWYPFDVTISPAYEIVFTHQVIAVCICGFLNIAKDCLAVTLIAQCHCRLKLLGLSLRTLCSDMIIPEDRLFSLEEEKQVATRLRLCVIRHQAVLETAKQLLLAYSEPIFIQFLVSLVIICVTAFQLVSQTDNMVRVVTMALYLMNMMYQVFIYCYQGNQLAEESAAVADAVYEVPWYACRVHVRRAVVLMNVRSRRVAILTAGGFTPLLLDSFMSIIKASYSMFTLLQRVEERN